MGEIFALPVVDRWLLYAPLRRVAAVVNRSAVKQFAYSAMPAACPEIEQLRAAIYDAPLLVPAPGQGQLEPQFLGLITTRACNLNCHYCGFGAVQSDKAVMGLDLAIAAVDWMAEWVEHIGRKTLDIHFFGGEPMVAHEVVEVAVHRSRAIAAEKELEARFEIATNGLFGPSLAEFLGTYVDSVVLSFDGPREIHDRHRSVSPGHGSFQTVARTAHYLSESETSLCLRACVTRDSVELIPEITEWFCKRFRPASINFEPLQPTEKAAAAGLLPPDPYAFAATFRTAQRIAAEYGVRCVYAASLVEEPRLSFCPVGNDTLIVAPDGSVRGCYLREAEWRARGLDLRVGRLSRSGEMKLDQPSIDRLRRLAGDKPACEQCFCRWNCAGGCHVNHSYPGALDDYDNFCVQTRLLTACELLERVGQVNTADRLLQDPTAAKVLARRHSDHLVDWDAQSVSGGHAHA